MLFLVLMDSSPNVIMFKASKFYLGAQQTLENMNRNIKHSNNTQRLFGGFCLTVYTGIHQGIFSEESSKMKKGICLFKWLFNKITWEVSNQFYLLCKLYTVYLFTTV